MPPGDPAGPGAGNGEARFVVDWELVVEDPAAEALGAALLPETGDHAELVVEGERLVARGSGGAGESLHTLDDLLACLGAALEAGEVE